MTQEREKYKAGNLISTWSVAVRLYAELDLDRATTAYVDFVREGSERGFPVINLRARYDFNEQLWYAMSYLLERALNNRWFRAESFNHNDRYEVELPCPSNEEMNIVANSLLYTRARALLRYTSTAIKYADKDSLLSYEDTDHDRKRKDAERRINHIKCYYSRRSIPQGQLFSCLVVLAVIIFAFLPQPYTNWYTFGVMQIAVLSILLISEIREHVLLERELHANHVTYLESNDMLRELLYREVQPQDKLKVSNLIKAEASLAALT